MQNSGYSELKSTCKICARASSERYRKANPEKESAKKRGWEKRNPERVKAFHDRYNEANPDKVKQSKLLYARRNPEKIAQNRKTWRKNNPERTRELGYFNGIRRRSRENKVLDNFTPQEWFNCLEYFNYCCAVCGAQLRDLFGNVTPHADHWIPLASSDCIGTTAKNMVCLCNNCNRSKWAKLPLVWLTEKYGTRKAKQILARIERYFEGL